MKGVTVQQLERDLDRILDDVIEHQEHFKISVNWITCSGTENEPCIQEQYQEKSIVMLPEEDYKFLQSIYKEWQEDEPIRYAMEDSEAFIPLRKTITKEELPYAWA